jgi:cytidylate kinase
MYFITVSEMVGTGGEKVARKIAEDLRYAFIGKEEIEEAASRMGFLADVVRIDDERKPSFLDRVFSEKSRIWLDRLQAVIYEVAGQGNAVFFGRGGMALLRTFECAFHVLVIGSVGKRVKRVMEEKGLGRPVAEKMIARSDHDKAGFLRFAFDGDWLNADLYDLVLNTDKLSVHDAARLVVEAARSNEVKEYGPEALKALKRLSLSCRIESALIEAGHRYVSIAVDDSGSVQVFGNVPTLEDREDVTGILKAFKEISSVKNDILIYPVSEV